MQVTLNSSRVRRDSRSTSTACPAGWLVHGMSSSDIVDTLSKKVSAMEFRRRRGARMQITTATMDTPRERRAQYMDQVDSRDTTKEPEIEQATAIPANEAEK